MDKSGFRNSVINRWKIYVSIYAGIFLFLLILMFSLKENVRRDKTYTNKKDVALYIKKYHELPQNYITKDGKDYFYDHNVSLTNYIVGGDTHYNDGKLSIYNVDNNTMLKECDIYFDGYKCNGNRGSNRLVYETNKSNPKVFFTSDHYASYDEITMLELMPAYYVFLAILIVYCISGAVFFSIIYIPKIKEITKKNKEVETKE